MIHRYIKYTIVLLAGLTACHPGNGPEPQNEDFSKTFEGRLYTYYRDYAPQSTTVVEQRDTFTLSLAIIRHGDSVSFIPSDLTKMPSYTFRVNDSIGINNYYWQNTYRPMENYQISGSKAIYYYSAAAPIGPYLYTKSFEGEELP